MTKNRHLRFLRNRILQKVINIMKLTTLLLLVNFMQVTASAYSQETRVTFSVKECKLEKIFDLLG